MMKDRMRRWKICLLATVTTMTLIQVGTVKGQAPNDGAGKIDAQVRGVMNEVIRWRRDIHQNPELGNREFRTAKLVEDHLRNIVIDTWT